MHISSAQIPIGVTPKPVTAAKPVTTDSHAAREPIGSNARIKEPTAELANAPKAEKAPEAARELRPLIHFSNQDFRTNTYLNIAHYDQDFPLIDVYA